MSGPVLAPPSAPPHESADPGALARLLRWRPTRRGVALAVLLGLTLVVLAVAAPGRSGYLDPEAVDPMGSRAVANVLGDLGVTVTDVRITSDVAANARGSTVLITETYLPTDEMIAEVLAAGPSRVVLVSPSPSDAAFVRLAAGTEPAPDPWTDEEVQPNCDLPEAQRAGAAVLPGLRYDARAWTGAGSACYDRPSAAAVVMLERREGRPEVVLLGSPHPLTNDGFDDAGNAALALNLLGSREQLVWWRPSVQDPALAGVAPTTVVELLPEWVVPVVVQLLVVCVVVVWWRGRRFGPLVVEPLPVIVRAGETTAGRARLLHANHARGEAAEHLRAAAREHLRRRLGLPVGAQPERLVAAAAARTTRSGAEVGALLYGPEPAVDSQLVALEHDLDELLRDVGTVEVGGR